MVVRVSAAEYEVDGQIEQILYKRDGGASAAEPRRMGLN